MSMIPWTALEEVYSSSGATGVKEFVKKQLQILTRPQQHELIQYALQKPFNDNNNDNKIPVLIHLLFIKHVLDVSGMVINSENVLLDFSFVKWLCDLVVHNWTDNNNNNTNEKDDMIEIQKKEITKSHCALIISIFGLIVKRFSKESSMKLLCISETIQFVLIECYKDMKKEHVCLSNILKSSCSMIINQVVDVISFAGDPGLEWLRPIGCCVEEACCILNYFCNVDLDEHSAVSSLSASVNQLQIKACKIFSMIVEIYMSIPLSSRKEIHTCQAFIEGPSHLTRMVSTSSIIHDIFQSTYQHLLDICQCSNVLNAHDAIHLIDDIHGAVSNQGQGILKSDQNEGEVYAYPSVVEIRRVECFLGFLSCILDYLGNHGALGDEDATCVANKVIMLIENVIKKLKASVNPSALKLSTSSTQDLRSACQDARKGCISVAHSLIKSLPNWLVLDLQRHQDRIISSAYWTLSVKLLTTPLLFGVAYQSSKSSSSTQQGLSRQILQYIANALKNITKYSYSVACDVLTSLEELSDMKCFELLLHESDIPLLVLNAYHCVPKGLNIDSKKAKQLSSANVYEWKINVINCIKALLLCVNISDLCGVLSSDFIDNFVVGVLSKDVVLLHGALGNITNDLAEYVTSTVKTEFLTIDYFEDWSSKCKASKYSLSISGKNRDVPDVDGCRHICADILNRMRFASAESSEPTVMLLHTVLLALVPFLDVLGTTKGDLSDPCSQGLLLLVCFLKEICHRKIIFEDDFVQLCVELEAIAKYMRVMIVHQQGKHDVMNLTSSFFQEYIKLCHQSLGQEFSLGASHAKIIYEVCYNELDRMVSCLLKSTNGGDADKENAMRTIPSSFELAVISLKGNNMNGKMRDEALDNIMQCIFGSVGTRKLS